MIKSSEDIVVLLVLLALFSPSILGLCIAFYKVYEDQVKGEDENLIACVVLHVGNLVVSPGIPAYLLHLDMETGGGSMASILSVFILPVTWVLFLVAQNQLKKTGSRDKAK